MKILSIETSSKMCGVSILENDNLIEKIELNNGLTHSESLMPVIDNIFNKANLELKDIDLIVSDIGPGSFTGIRIGVATAKAFSDSLNINCVGISSLEALAYNVKENGFICSIIDCKNDNCYYALYKLENGFYSCIINPKADTLDNALIDLKNITEPIFFVGDGSIIYKEKIQTSLPNSKFANNNNIDTYNLGLAGLNLYKSGIYNSNVLPLYLRKPQAERQMEEKENQINISQMTLADLESIKDILISEFDDFWTESIFKEELKSDNSNYIVAKNGLNKIVGFGGYKILVDNADIMNIVTKKSARNTGIGTLILKNIIELIKFQNINHIILEVNENNIPAINLYKKFGFETIAERKNYYNGTDNAIIMELKIQKD
ncbi:MAG: tRNA (adenosine(37)-N6)-threonylcarbamoyltransferase complex dimerization subunit type 1 TsaB [Clostridia bacterium]|nr:tRNA (adenosine(37)-N6)-threonylcarbamoyltransferase complex dimerization subunit type 1 TsaB [Clostridia bacterium]